MDLSFSPSWKMESMKDKFIGTDKMMIHIPNCSEMITDTIKNGLIIEAASRGVGKNPRRAHLILQKSDTI